MRAKIWQIESQARSKVLPGVRVGGFVRVWASLAKAVREERARQHAEFMRRIAGVVKILSDEEDAAREEIVHAEQQANDNAWLCFEKGRTTIQVFLS